MTRRIALAILLTCWLVLLAGGALAYVGVRHALLADLDASLALRASSLPEVFGLGVPEAAAGHALPEGDRYLIRNARGRTLARPPATGPTAISSPTIAATTSTTTLSAVAPARPPHVRSKRFVTLADGTRGRSITLAYPTADFGGATGSGGNEEMMVLYTGSAEPFDRTVNRLMLIFAGVGLAAGLLTACAARAVARSALRPLTDTSRTIQSIDDRTLDRRLDVNALPPELRPMCERLNQLLARLDDGLKERKQFVADAAHQLRTPVTALLTSMEVTLRRPRDADALTRVLRECVEDARVLRRLVEALLEQFRIDATPPALERVNVSAVLELCVDGVASMARQRDVRVIRAYAGDLWTVADGTRLRSIVANMLDNAIDYNVPGGTVEVACTLSADAIELVVTDTGRGISETLVPNVFEPFVRGSDDDDGRGARHTGLGLFLVRSHVTALGGSCRVSSVVGRGSEFRIRLPRVGLDQDPPAALAGAGRTLPARVEKELPVLTAVSSSSPIQQQV